MMGETRCPRTEPNEQTARHSRLATRQKGSRDLKPALTATYSFNRHFTPGQQPRQARDGVQKVNAVVEKGEPFR